MWGVAYEINRENLFAAIKNRKLVASNERCGYSGATDGVDIVEAVTAARLRGKNVELVGRRICWSDSEEEHAVAFALHQCHRSNGCLKRRSALETREGHV
jgi:hypothetical protein